MRRIFTPVWVVLELGYELFRVILLYLHVGCVLKAHYIVFCPLFFNGLNNMVLWVNFVRLELLHLLVPYSILELLMDRHVRRLFPRWFRELLLETGPLIFVLATTFEGELNESLLSLSLHHDGDVLLWSQIFELISRALPLIYIFNIGYFDESRVLKAVRRQYVERHRVEVTL